MSDQQKNNHGFIFACGFHTSSRLNIDPAIWPILRNLLKGTGIISGRGFRKWWQSLPDKKRKYFVHSAKRRYQEVALLIITVWVCFYIYYRTHLQVAPVTERKRFIAFTDYQFNKIMNFHAQQLCEQMKEVLLPVNHIYYRVVIATLSHLINANKDIKELENFKWTVAVVDNPAVNAFVLPTGHVFVNRGLLEFVMDQDQLAVVLAHEMSHALLKHGAEDLSRLQLLDYLIISIMTAIWALMPNDGIAVVTHWFFNRVVKVMLNLPYSRFLEEEADKVGLELAAKACFDIRCGTVFWTLMDWSEQLENRKSPEWLSTHPSSHKRAELFDCLLHKYIHVRLECNCPQLPEKDPRDIVHQVKPKFENLMISRQTKANIERFKIPLPYHNDKHIIMSAVENFKEREFVAKISLLPDTVNSKDLKQQEKQTEKNEKVDEKIVTADKKTD